MRYLNEEDIQGQLSFTELEWFMKSLNHRKIKKD